MCTHQVTHHVWLHLALCTSYTCLILHWQFVQPYRTVGLVSQWKSPSDKSWKIMIFVFFPICLVPSLQLTLFAFKLLQQKWRSRVSTNHSERSVYRAANAIFGKIGRIATEEVVLHSAANQSVPILLLWSCSLLNKETDLDSLDFVVNRFFVKLFHTLCSEKTPTFVFLHNS